MSTLGTKIEQYIKLREHKAAAKKAFDKSMERINLAIEKLDGEILKALDAEDMNSFQSDSGTAYKNIQSSATVKEREEFVEWCRETGNEAAMDIRANKAVVREILSQGEDVPGVKFSERVTIGVRRKRNG